MSVISLLAETWAFLLSNSNRFFDLLGRHLELVVVSELLAIVIAVPLGILATRNDCVNMVVSGGGNVAQTVPTLAVIALVFPLLGLGFLPSVVGLFTYSLLPILTNTIAGIESVSESTVDAARGMGMTDWEILRKVRLPLASPVIFAGIRTSTVLNVGAAYLAFFIGGGGLGVWVIGGIKLFSTTQVLAGAIPGALLAIMLDGALGLVERRLGTDTSAGQATVTA